MTHIRRILAVVTFLAAMAAGLVTMASPSAATGSSGTCEVNVPGGVGCILSYDIH